MEVSSSPVIPRPRPSEPQTMSSRTEQSSRAHQEPQTASLKLPLLQDLTNSDQGMTSSDTSIDHRSGQTTGRVNVSSFSQNEAISLLQQYNKIVGEDSRIHQPVLPQINMNMRPEGYKPIPARDRFTTKSLDRIENIGKKVFTEGLSSKSKFKEPLLAVHRRDIIGANMPETVRLARERSNIVFGLNRYRPKKPRHDVAGRNGNIKGITLEPASVTASQIMAPLALPQKVDINDVWGDNSKDESKIARMLRTMEARYGRDMFGQAVPSSPSLQSVDFMTSNSAATPVMTPRKTSIMAEKKGKPNLSVVSLGESLANLPPKPRPSVKLPYKNRDNGYNQLERYRQHTDDRKLNRFEIRYNKDRKPGVHPVIGEMRTAIGQRGKAKPGVRKKRQIVVSLKELTSQGQDEDEQPKGKAGTEIKQDGKFNVAGVKGIATGPRLWSPSSVSTSASVTNPPPSVEVGLFDLEFPHVKDPAAIFIADEEKSKGDPGHLAVLTDGHLSDGNSSLVSSTHLSVPSLGTGKECVPLMEAAWGERPPRKDDPMAGVDYTFGDSTDTPSSPQRPNCVSSEVKVTTLELFPGSSGSQVRPTISISGSDEVEADLQKHRNADVKERDGGYPSGESGSGVHNSAVSEINQTSVHNQSITFISPLQTQRNAKRQ